MRVSDHPISVALRQRGSTKRWFASQVGMDDTHLSHVLAGRRPAPSTFYADAARILNVPEDWLRPSEGVEALAA